MVCHNCPRCGYKATKKSHLKDHYNRKTICNPIVADISIEECIKGMDIKRKYLCEYCNKKYSRSDSLNRHKNKCVEKRLQMLEEKNKELEKKLNNSNNITITNSDVNSHNKTIIINNYKDTNYSDVIDDIRHSLNNELIPKFDKLIRLIFFNEEYPENHNICIPDINRGRVLVKEDGDFKLKSKDYVDDVIKDIEEFLKKEEIDKKAFKKHMNYIRLGDNEYLHGIKEDATLELYNGRKYVFKNM